MLVHWIWLATRHGLSDRMKVAVLQHFQDPEDAYYADVDALRRVEGITQEHLEALEDKNLKPARKILDQCTDRDIHILTFQDATLSTSFTIVQAFPGFYDVGSSFFFGRLIYLRRLHRYGIILWTL